MIDDDTNKVDYIYIDYLYFESKLILFSLKTLNS